MVAHRLPTSSNVRWNFHSRAINAVFEHREDLIQCFENIQDLGGFDASTIREAGAMAMLLEHQDFKFFLELFHHIMPRVDLLYAKLQKKNIDAVHIKVSIQQFEQDIENIRNPLHSVDEQRSGCPTAKRRRALSSEDRQRVAEEGLGVWCCLVGSLKPTPMLSWTHGKEFFKSHLDNPSTC